MCADVCEHLCTLARVSVQVKEMALSSHYSTTHNHRQQILDNSSYSLFRRPWIPKTEDRREKDADGQLATTTSPIYPITQSVSTDRLPHITGPNISLWQYALRTASLSLPCSLSLSSHLLWLPRNPNNFIFPSDKDLEDLTSGLTGNISKQLLKMKRGIVKHCAMKEKVLTYTTFPSLL